MGRERKRDEGEKERERGERERGVLGRVVSCH